METVNSKNGVPVRLPDERWPHISEEHGERADPGGRKFSILPRSRNGFWRAARANFWPSAKWNPAGIWSSPIES